MPHCETHDDCGDGYACRSDGRCEEVISAIGDPCVRERDCGPGQTCLVEPIDRDDGAPMPSSCQPQGPGGTSGEPCAVGADCQTGMCVLDRCTEVCAEPGDCPGNLACTELPQAIDTSGAGYFRGCLQASGVLVNRIPTSGPSPHIRLPVPGNARSVTIVTRVSDASLLVGVSRLDDPVGATLYRAHSNNTEYLANPIRYSEARGLATMLLSNTDAFNIRPGVYELDVDARFFTNEPASEAPEVTVFYKLDEGAVLDLEFVFLDLEDHPCQSAWGDGLLDAEAAQAETGPFQEEFLLRLFDILSQADLSVGTISYRDEERADLDSVHRDYVDQLFELSTAETGITVFITRSLAPAGVQALVGDVPGPPRLPGTSRSGVALSADTLCYRDWNGFARTAAHALALQMGLFENISPAGFDDPISDNSTERSNLTHYSEFGGTNLSEGQSAVLRRSAVLR